MAAFGVAVSAYLVLMLLATAHGVESSVRAYVGQPGIDLWVSPKGTDNLVRSSAVLPGAVADEIEATEGVARLGRLVRGFVTATSPATPQGITLMLLCYDAPDGLAGPPRLVEGAPPSGTDTVVLDRAAAHRLDLAVGDTVTLNGREVEISGLSGGTNLVATQFVFMDRAAAERLTGYSGQVSFLAVDLDEDVDAAKVSAALLARWPDGIATHLPERFVARNLEEVGAGFLPMQLLVAGVGLVASAVLVSLLVQGLVEDRRQDLAVLLAMGADLRQLALGVVLDTMLLVGLGAVGGAAGTRLTQGLTARWAPTIAMNATLADALGILGLLLLVGAVAAVLPLARLRRIDPVEAFRP